jgi:pimeloyl-ACP methyl ester carboxylesterase
MPQPTIVLVHGAFAESASWNDVALQFHDQGYFVMAAPNPLRGVTSDSEFVASILASLRGPIVLVGHSYGGAVITNAARGNENVKALVYVAGFAPDSGENIGELSARFPGSTLGDTLMAVTLPDGSKDFYIRQDRFHAQFSADLPADMAILMAMNQRPLRDVALNEGSGQPAWRSIPSWFVIPELDRNIPAEAHRFMARRARAQEVLEIEGASHSVAISHADEVAGVVLRAARFVEAPLRQPQPMEEQMSPMS